MPISKERAQKLAGVTMVIEHKRQSTEFVGGGSGTSKFRSRLPQKMDESAAQGEISEKSKLAANYIP